MVKIKVKKKNDKQNLPPKIEVMADSNILKGAYSNYAIVQHTPNEFIIDFMLQMAGQITHTSRVILSPNHMKSLQQAIKTNIENYESKFGKVMSPK